MPIRPTFFIPRFLTTVIVWLFVACPNTWGQTRFESPTDATEQIRRESVRLEKENDRRALFALVYAATLDSIMQSLDRTKDPSFILRLLVEHSNLYEISYQQSLFGSGFVKSEVWKIVFQKAEENTTPLASLLVLSMNAHIAYDMVEALIKVKADLNNKSVRHDYFLITRVLQEILPKLWAIYESKTHAYSEAKSRLYQSIIAGWVKKIRRVAYSNAIRCSRVDGKRQEACLARLRLKVANQAPVLSWTTATFD